MGQGKDKNGVIILLVILVIILAVLCVLFATGTIDLKSDSENNNQNTNDTTNTTEVSKNNISSVVGMYSAKFENLKDDENMSSASITLYLYENGVFTYVFNQFAPVGVLGNYTVEDDKIILTNWFNSNSGTDLSITKGSKTLTINSDGSITDSNIKNKSLVDNNITTANLIKGDSQSQFDLSNRLGTAFFTSEDHTISEPAM